MNCPKLHKECERFIMLGNVPCCSSSSGDSFVAIDDDLYCNVAEEEWSLKAIIPTQTNPECYN